MQELLVFRCKSYDMITCYREQEDMLI